MDVVAFDAFWQEPAKTEKHAYDLIVKLKPHIPGALYLAFPWATLIDSIERGVQQAAVLEAELKMLESRYEKKGLVVTVCQHIKYRKYLPLFRSLGVTDIYCSHNEKGSRLEQGVRLWPFQLYAAQRPDAVEPDPFEAESFRKRDYAFSYIGAYSTGYLSNVRQMIVDELPAAPGAYIKSRNEWHYEKQVYKKQIHSRELTPEDMKEIGNNELEYKEVMRRSKFVLCPSGTGPNSIRFWEALEFGCIPILLSDKLALPGDSSLWDKGILSFPETLEGVRAIPTKVQKVLQDPSAMQGRLDALQALHRTYGTDNMVCQMLTQLDSQAKVVSRIHPDGSRPRIIVDVRALSSADLDIRMNAIRSQISYMEMPEIFLLTETGVVAEKGGEIIAGRFEALGLMDIRAQFAVVVKLRNLTWPLLSRISQLLIIATEDWFLEDGRADDSVIHSCARRYGYFDVSLVTSVYKGTAFLPDFLASLGNYSIRRQIEHLLIVASSPEDDASLLLASPATYALNMAIVYLPEDPGLYEVWNLGVLISSGRFLGNANLDDLRGPRQVEVLVARLESAPESGLASAAIAVTTDPAGIWEDAGSLPAWYSDLGSSTYSASSLYRVDTSGMVIPHNIPHCSPLWRKTLHYRYGYFSEAKFGPSSDWEFWLRCAACGVQFEHENEVLGMYYKNPDTYWRRNKQTQLFEANILRFHFSGSQLLSRYDGAEKHLLTRILLEHYQRKMWLGVLLLAFDVVGDGRWESGSSAVAFVKKVLSFALELDGDESFNIISDQFRGRHGAISSAVIALARFIEVPPGAICKPGTLKRISEIASDLYSQFREPLALLVLAKITFRNGDIDLCREYVGSAERQLGSNETWEGMAQVFGRDASTKQLAQLIGARTKEASYQEIIAAKVVYVFPDYRAGNDYQQLLYQHIPGVPGRLKFIDDIAAINADAVLAGDVLHVHWINAITRNLAAEDCASAYERCLHHLNDLKRRGLVLIWTIHNSHNHESQDLQAEIRFRTELSQLCDRVYVHHPAAPELFKPWLKDSIGVQYYEHGAYQVEGTVSAEELAKFRDKLRLPSEAIVIAMVGQVRPYKQLHAYLGKMLELVQSTPSVHLLVAGKISCDQSRQILSQAESPQLIFMDRHISNAEIELIYSLADAAFLAYSRIVTSGAMFAALSRNVPVIAPRMGTIPYYIFSGVNGWLYEGPHDFEHAFRAALRRILESRNRGVKKLELRSGLPDWPTAEAQSHINWNVRSGGPGACSDGEKNIRAPLIDSECVMPAKAGIEKNQQPGSPPWRE